MASALDNMYPDQYYHNGKDIANTTNIQESHVTVKPTQHNARSIDHPPIQRTPFVPIANWPQPYHPTCDSQQRPPTNFNASDELQLLEHTAVTTRCLPNTTHAAIHASTHLCPSSELY